MSSLLLLTSVYHHSIPTSGAKNHRNITSLGASRCRPTDPATQSDLSTLQKTRDLEPVWIQNGSREDTISVLTLNLLISSTIMALLFEWLLPIVLAVLFAYIDVWYFLRFFVLGLRIKLNKQSAGGKSKRSKSDLLASYDRHGIVMPSDLDCMLHMNNSRYLREMDYGRLGMFFERDVYTAVRANNGATALAAHCIRYRRSLTLFQRFVLRTRVLCWDDDALYVEQRMLRKSDSFVCAINLAKLVMKGTTVPAVLKTWLGESVDSPPFPPEVTSWRESIAASSKALLAERQQTQ